ncbi:unnamed protein product [Protopolystoma xenopodis]|uniref:Uncharacterized protein n=1 Tax=Protopolystoma xenopodis TaxID=117903 RepID=A0A448X114_9PLAT|nr:unnamed protein product [Protopolystoma xenopodis]
MSKNCIILNQSLLRIYAVPDNAFDEKEAEGDDEEEVTLLSEHLKPTVNIPAVNNTVGTRLTIGASSSRGDSDDPARLTIEAEKSGSEKPTDVSS